MSALGVCLTRVKESSCKAFSRAGVSMLFALALLPCFFLSGLLHAQNLTCSSCAKSETGPLPQSRAVCLSEKELVAHIATRKPVGPPGLNEPHMNSHGTVAACVCFARTSKVTDVRILSGPPIMQQSVLESLKDWTFRPVKQNGRHFGGCGTLHIQVDMNDSQVTTTIEE
jgi:hypothetical protein